MACQAGGERPLQRTLCLEGPEELRTAAVPGGDGAGLGSGRVQEKAEREVKKPTAPGIPRRSPIQVLTRPDPA